MFLISYCNKLAAMKSQIQDRHLEGRWFIIYFSQGYLSQGARHLNGYTFRFMLGRLLKESEQQQG